jgi:hypothetical protein
VLFTKRQGHIKDDDLLWKNNKKSDLVKASQPSRAVQQRNEKHSGQEDTLQE